MMQYLIAVGFLVSLEASTLAQPCPRTIDNRFAVPGVAGGSYFYLSNSPRVAALHFTNTGGVQSAIIGGAFGMCGDVRAPYMAGLLEGVPFDLAADLNGDVLALASFDDGNGPMLYIGGRFTFAGGGPVNGIARWTGSAWEPVGLGVAGEGVFALQVFDDGTGPALYAGGSFSRAGSSLASNIAKWDGTTWSDVGGGLGDPGAYYAVQALTVHPTSSGSILIAGGRFNRAGAVACANAAQWDGTSWGSLGSELGYGGFYGVRALVSMQLKGQRRLFAGGDFSPPNSNFDRGGIAEWNGTSWDELDGGLSASNGGGPSVSSGHAAALGVLHSGAGPQLVVGGAFDHAGIVPARNIAAWDGQQWHALGDGIGGPNPRQVWVFDDVIAAIAEDPSAPGSLLVGGSFEIAGAGGASNIAKWTGGAWQSVLSGLGVSQSSGYYYSGPVSASTLYKDGATSRVLIGGAFSAAGTTACGGLARWQDGAWQEIGSFANPPQVGEVAALLQVAAPGLRGLYVGGWFTSVDGMLVSNIASWEGSQWAPLGSGVNGGVSALCAFGDGAAAVLLAAGRFTSAGGVPASNIAAWNGASWAPLDAGVSGSSYPSVYTMAAFDDGRGPSVFVGGTFTTAGNQFAVGVARWDGSAWHAVGNGLFPAQGFPYPYVSQLFPWIDSVGRHLLLAAGSFRIPGQPGDAGAAVWDGTSWQSLDGIAYVSRFATWDDGRGAQLLAAGSRSDGYEYIYGLYAWSGNEWTRLATVSNNASSPYGYANVSTLQTATEQGRSVLWLGGRFDHVENVASNGVARIEGCGAPCTGDVNADGAVDFLDLNEMLSQYGRVGTGLFGDVDANSQVDFVDLNIVLGNYGTNCQP